MTAYKKVSIGLSLLTLIFMVGCHLAEYGEDLGVFIIGHTHTTIENTSTNRDMKVDIWYPSNPIDFDHTQAKTQYVIPDSYKSLILGADSLVESMVGPTSDHAYNNPDIYTYAGFKGYPIVIYSHGDFSFSLQSYELMEHIASHGFFVISLDHSTSNEVTRISDIHHVIEDLTKWNQDPNHPFYQALDLDKIALMGESRGGLTTFMAGLGSNENPRDERIKAIIPMATPLPRHFDAYLQSSPIPVFVINGTLDTHAEPGDSVHAFSQLPANGQSYHLEIHGATHTQFSSVEHMANWVLAEGLERHRWPYPLEYAYAQAMEEAGIPHQDTAKFIRKRIINFLHVHLRGQKPYSKYINPDHPKYIADDHAPVRHK